MQTVFCQLSAVVPLTGGDPLPRACVCRLVALLKARHERRVRAHRRMGSWGAADRHGRQKRSNAASREPSAVRASDRRHQAPDRAGRSNRWKRLRQLAGLQACRFGMPVFRFRLEEATGFIKGRRRSTSGGYQGPQRRDIVAPHLRLAVSALRRNGRRFLKGGRSRSQTSNCRKGQTVALPDGSLFIAAAINTAVLKDRDDVLHEFLDIVGRSWRLERVAVDSAVVPQVD